jgi:hypothetical protein
LPLTTRSPFLGCILGHNSSPIHWLYKGTTLFDLSVLGNATQDGSSCDCITKRRGTAK